MEGGRNYGSIKTGIKRLKRRRKQTHKNTLEVDSYGRNKRVRPCVVCESEKEGALPHPRIANQQHLEQEVILIVHPRQPRVRGGSQRRPPVLFCAQEKAQLRQLRTREAEAERKGDGEKANALAFVSIIPPGKPSFYPFRPFASSPTRHARAEHRPRSQFASSECSHRAGPAFA
jgi:hypothetical protein